MLALMVIMLAGVNMVYAGLGDWTMFHHDQYNNVESTSTGPETRKVLWTYSTGDYVESSPAVADGKVYVGSNDGNVYCLDASTGVKVWNYTTGGAVRSSPAVADGRVYVGCWGDNNFYCLDAATGDKIWNYTTGSDVWSSPAVADGRVYIGSIDDKVYCFGSAITRDDILYKIELMEPGDGGCCNETQEDLDKIKVKIDELETQLDDCCNTTHSKLDDILRKLGLPVGGGLLPFKLPEALEFVSDNIQAVALLALFSLVALWVTRKQS